jgi:uncharacterized protein (TIGR02646 family)
MRVITKGPEPITLRNHRATPGAIYDGKDFNIVKDEIRAALLKEQFALCCYCMRRISNDLRPNPTATPIVQMKVEHWKPQSTYPHLQLSWTNMLGACLGGIGNAPADQTCDTRRGQAPLLLDPQSAAHLLTIKCSSGGLLSSTNPHIHSDIDGVLGLNHPILTNGRRAVIDSYISRIVRKYRDSTIPEKALRPLVAQLESPINGKLAEHCSVLRLWARKRFGSETWH